MRSIYSKQQMSQQNDLFKTRSNMFVETFPNIEKPILNHSDVALHATAFIANYQIQNVTEWNVYIESVAPASSYLCMCICLQTLRDSLAILWVFVDKQLAHYAVSSACL